MMNNLVMKEIKKTGQYLNAALYVPKTEPEEKYPLVLFLHGAGERGEDIHKVLDFTPGADAFTAESWQKEHPCFVLMPQCPDGKTWLPFIDLLADALNALPQDNRDILLMYWFLEMADREIAERMNLARRTINNRRLKSYRLLKELMGGDTDA